MASYERTLEDTLEAKLEALTYITANSVPVLNWGDVTSDTAYPCVSVRVQPRERLAPNADYYRLTCEVVAYRYMQDDKNQVTSGKALDEIFAEISNWAHGLGSDRPHLVFSDGEYLSGTASVSDPIYRATNGDGRAWTVSIYIKPSSNTSAKQTILGYGNAFGGIAEIYYDGTDGQKNVTLKYGKTSQYLQMTTLANSVTVGAWNHIMITFDGGTTGLDAGAVSDYYGRFKIFVNGIPAATTNSTPSNGYGGSISDTAFILGKFLDTHLEDEFGLDEFAWWDSDVSGNLSTIYNGGKPHDLGLLATAPMNYWKLGHDDALPVVPDDIGSHDLASTNMTDGDNIKGLITGLPFVVDGVVNVAGIEDISDGIHSKGVSFEIYDTIA